MTPSKTKSLCSPPIHFTETSSFARTLDEANNNADAGSCVTYNWVHIKLPVIAGIVTGGTDRCQCTLLFHCPNVRAALFCRTFSEFLNLVIFEEVLFLRTSLGNLKVNYARGWQTLETLTRVELRGRCHSDCVNLHLSGRQLETEFCYPSLLTEALCPQVI